MQIAYLYYLITKAQLGIEEKIRRQEQALHAAGIRDLKLIVLSRNAMETPAQVNFQRLRHGASFLRPYDYLLGRYALIQRSVDLSSYDAVILRYPLADPSGLTFSSRFPIVTEHHTLEIPELQSRRLQGSYVEGMARRLLLALERRYGGQILSNCRGIIGVTEEISDYQVARSGTEIPSTTIGNGIDVQGTELIGFTPFNGNQLHLLFVAGNIRPWHGLDRAVQSINGYQGNVDITLHVIGSPPETLPTVISPSRIIFHGPAFGKALDEIASKCNLAIGSLAMFRNNMEEASSLKTRDYMARGIPFVLAHKDPDLPQEDEDNAFYLRFPNDDSLLDLERVLDFAWRVSRRSRQVSRQMREYALTHMDWRVKLRSYVDFVRSVV